MHRISANFIYAFILTRSTLGLLHIIFRTIVPELWPLIYSKISFPLNILRTNGQILIKLFIGALLKFKFSKKTYLIVIKDEIGLKFKMNDSTLFLIGSYAQKLVASY